MGWDSNEERIERSSRDVDACVKCFEPRVVNSPL